MMIANLSRHVKRVEREFAKMIYTSFACAHMLACVVSPFHPLVTNQGLLTITTQAIYAIFKSGNRMTKFSDDAGGYEAISWSTSTDISDGETSSRISVF
jgi:hypothetical protein